MLKKIVTSFLVILWLSSISLVIYRSFEPQAALAYNDQPAVRNVANNIINAEESTSQDSAMLMVEDEVEVAAEEVEETSITNYYFFCTVDNPDCTYINEYVVPPLLDELGQQELNILEYYDITNSTEAWTPSRLKAEWGFDNYPAFVAIATHPDESQEILSVLQWSDDAPINAERLKIWMVDNDIWTGAIEEQGEIIENPNF